jgi:hypothetical protein
MIGSENIGLPLAIMYKPFVMMAKNSLKKEMLR